MGEEPETLLDGWLPSPERAVVCNGWSDDECLLQLAGRLRGRGIQEWRLLNQNSRRTFMQLSMLSALILILVVEPLQPRISATPEGKHVADFLWRSEQTFKVAYGRDVMSSETQDTLPYGQLQNELWHDLMQGPAVLDAQTYKELCLAAINEEK